jgi:hypothetical protein
LDVGWIGFKGSWENELYTVIPLWSIIGIDGLRFESAAKYDLIIIKPL